MWAPSLPSGAAISTTLTPAKGVGTGAEVNAYDRAPCDLETVNVHTAVMDAINGGTIILYARFLVDHVGNGSNGSHARGPRNRSNL